MSGDEKATARYVNDPRVDKGITWALTALAAVAFSVGAWFFNDLKATQKEFAISQRIASKEQASAQTKLAEAIGQLGTEVAVLKNQQAALSRLRELIKEIRSDVRQNRDHLSERWKKPDHMVYAAEVNTRFAKVWDVVNGIREEQTRRTGNVYRVNKLAKDVEDLEARLKAVEK